MSDPPGQSFPSFKQLCMGTEEEEQLDDEFQRQHQDGEPEDESILQVRAHQVPIVEAVLIHPVAVPKDLLCPLSNELFRDPVVLFPSGITYDKEHLCRYLLQTPDKDPFTKQMYHDKNILQYTDNLLVQRMLIQTLGREAYQKFDDSQFHRQYNALWKTLRTSATTTAASNHSNHTDLYQQLDSFMFGMNQHRIDMEQAALLASSGPDNDPVIVAYRAWLTDPNAANIRARRIRKDARAAAELWQRAVALGLPQLAQSKQNKWALAMEGRRHFLSLQNRQRASEFYQMAVEREHIPSFWALGNMYRREGGVILDPVQARDLYAQAAQYGHAPAQTNLGTMYALGQGVEADSVTAVELFRKAAEQGDDVGQYNLGYMYKNGRGVSQDYAAAAFWYGRAADQGNERAMGILGRTKGPLRRQS